jgi:hypothetical protein
LQELEERIKDVRGEEEKTESDASTCENLLETIPLHLRYFCHKLLMRQVTI